MRAQRARFLLAMGLPQAVACDSEPPVRHPDGVMTAPTAATVAAPATVAPPPTVAVTATATATDTATNTPPLPPPRGLSNVPNFSAQYPFVNQSGCTTATAHCYLLADLQKLVKVVGACPAHEDVPQGCMGGAVCTDPGARTTGDLLPAVSRAQTAEKKTQACCYTVPDLCCAACGRTLRDGDRVVLTPLVTSDATPLEGQAAHFAAMASAEHASIASFARTSLELMALGAPADLVRDTHLAALDEIEHARQCFALASKLAGHEVAPGLLATPAITKPTLASFAVSTFVDACVGETLGAAQLREMASRETDREVAVMLEAIALDEERHAELAFRTLAWAVRAGGTAAALAVRDAAVHLAPSSQAHDAVREVVLPCVWALIDLQVPTTRTC